MAMPTQIAAAKANGRIKGSIHAKPHATDLGSAIVSQANKKCYLKSRDGPATRTRLGRKKKCPRNTQRSYGAHRGHQNHEINAFNTAFAPLIS
jgi:hypothetical protein